MPLRTGVGSALPPPDSSPRYVPVVTRSGEVAVPRVLPAVLLLLGGLYAQAQEAAPLAPEPAMTAPARLDWTLTLTPGGDALEVRYTVTSTSDATIYLADLTPVPGEGGFLYGEQFINVAGTPTPGLIRLVRGRLASVAPTLLPLDPGARALDPGKTATGMATIKLPIAPAHYHGKAAPLNGEPARATLEIGYLVGEVHWTALPLADGRSLTVSSPADEMRYLSAGPLPIPAPQGTPHG